MGYTLKFTGAEIDSRLEQVTKKQDIITDLDQIRNGATLGKTALQNADNAVTVANIQDYTFAPMLKTEWVGGSVVSDTDYNSFVEEIYIKPEYIAQQIGLRKYKDGYVIRAFTNNNSAIWGIVQKTDLQGKLNGEIIPLVLTEVTDTTSGASVGDIVGYIVFKDVSGFVALADDFSKGQKIDVAIVTKLFALPKILSFVKGIGESSKEADAEINIYLPSTLYAVVGDTLQLFYRNLLDCAKIDMYDISAECSVGKSYPRYFEFTPTNSDVGKDYALTINVRDRATHIVAKKMVTIKARATMSAPSSMKNILCVGASATANGHWAGELKRRLVETSGAGTPSNPKGLGLSNIEFIGRRKGSYADVLLEATGGWKVKDYASAGNLAYRFQVTNVDTLSIGTRYKADNGNIFVVQEINVTNGVGNIRCTLESKPSIASTGVLTRIDGSGDNTITYTSYTEESFSAFWNTDTQKIDFKNYANKYCNGDSIDIMIWHCGANDIVAGTDSSIDLAISSFRSILEQYHADYPNGKVIISSIPIGSLNGGFASNYGASATTNAMVFMNQALQYAKRLQELCGEYPFTYYAAALEEFDTENGYPTKSVAVNNRVSTQETIGTNALHPTTEGSYMVSDAIYRVFNAFAW